MASQLLESGVYAVGFFFPVVPQGKARIRTQVSSALTRADLEQAVSAFVKARAAATK
jgi:glycine C-acetyltransferase